jgi:hypothetical protein
LPRSRPESLAIASKDEHGETAARFIRRFDDFVCAIHAFGSETLHRDEVKANTITIDVLTDKDSNVVDARDTEQFSRAIVALGSAEAQPLLRRIFSPERLKALAIERSIELHSDFVGRPAQPGSIWMANDANKGAMRQTRVLAEGPCGANRCVQVRHEYDLDRPALYADISPRVGAYVQAQGEDPSKVAVSGMDLKLEDSLLSASARMEHYGAQFIEEAKLKRHGAERGAPNELQDPASDRVSLLILIRKARPRLTAQAVSRGPVHSCCGYGRERPAKLPPIASIESYRI